MQHGQEVGIEDPRAAGELVRGAVQVRVADLVAAEDEVAQGRVTLKEMASGSEEKLSLSQVLDRLT